jgi:hypothetical protein
VQVSARSYPKKQMAFATCLLFAVQITKCPFEIDRRFPGTFVEAENAPGVL